MDSPSISSELFGAVQTGYRGLTGFRSLADELGLTLVRWPGGGLAEKNTSAYGLDLPILLDASRFSHATDTTSTSGLPQMLEYAVERGATLSIVIPTARYACDISTGLLHVVSFVRKLCQGGYGPLPDRLILEIGDDYAGQEVFDGNAPLYGRIACRFIEVISEAISDILPDGRPRVTIAVQMGSNWRDDVAIRAQMSHHALAAIGALSFHHFPISLKNAHVRTTSETIIDSGRDKFERTKAYYDAWWKAIHYTAPQSPKPGLFLSSWTIGSTEPRVAIDKLRYNDFGIRGASAAVDLIHNYTSIGVDMAAVWGIDTPSPCLTSVTRQGDTLTTPFGAILSMMSESLVGTAPLPGCGRPEHDRPVTVYSFEAEGRRVHYVAAKEVPAEGCKIILPLEQPYADWIVSARVLEAVLPPAYEHFSGTSEARLYELPVIRRSSPMSTPKGLALQFDQSFSVMEITMTSPRAKVAPATVAESTDPRPPFSRPLHETPQAFHSEEFSEPSEQPNVALVSLLVASLAAVLLTVTSLLSGWGVLAAIPVFIGSQVSIFTMCIFAYIAGDWLVGRGRRKSR